MLISGGEEFDKGGARETLSGVVNALCLDRCIGYMYTFIKTHQTLLSRSVHLTVSKLCLTKIIMRE